MPKELPVSDAVEILASLFREGTSKRGIGARALELVEQITSIEVILLQENAESGGGRINEYLDVVKLVGNLDINNDTAIDNMVTRIRGAARLIQLAERQI